jgi:hypothetical protein
MFSQSPSPEMRSIGLWPDLDSVEASNTANGEESLDKSLSLFQDDVSLDATAQPPLMRSFSGTAASIFSETTLAKLTSYATTSTLLQQDLTTTEVIEQSNDRVSIKAPPIREQGREIVLQQQRASRRELIEQRRQHGITAVMQPELLPIQPAIAPVNITLIESILSSAYYYQYFASAISTISTDTSNVEVADKSQTVLLKNINRYLSAINKPLISEKGYCNGISLLWLTMMALKVEALFYYMVDQIALCPPEQLHQINETILTFLFWIDLGQNPALYTQHSYSAIDKIIGLNNITTTHAVLAKTNLQVALTRRVQREALVCIKGWAKEDSTIGHAIGLFWRGKTHYLFDANFKSGRSQIVSRKSLGTAVKNRFAEAVSDEEKLLIQIDASLPLPEARVETLYPRLFDSERAQFYARVSKAKPVSATASQHSSVSSTETQAIAATLQMHR